MRESTKNVQMVYNNNTIFIIILIITIIKENVSSEHLGCDNQNGTEINWSQDKEDKDTIIYNSICKLCFKDVVVEEQLV